MSTFNATGLVMADATVHADGSVTGRCPHGITHAAAVALGMPPAAPKDQDKLYVRSRYLRADGRCVVCWGEPKPADLTEPLA